MTAGASVLLTVICGALVSVNCKPQYEQIEYGKNIYLGALDNIYISTAAVVRTPVPRCRAPYEQIGDQCLYFSRPYKPWGVADTWDQVCTLVCRYYL